MGNPAVTIVILTREPTWAIYKDLRTQSYRDFEVILATEDGIVNAMNIALKKSKGEILVRIDDDVRLPKTWLEELIKPFDDPKVAGVTGPTLVPEERRGNRISIKIFNIC